MKIQEYCQALDKLLDAETSDITRLEAFNNAITKAFKTRENELAIFGVDPERQEFRFLWPLRLTSAGKIPMTLRDSLLARTAAEMKPLLNNRFTSLRHAGIFETIPLDKAIAGAEKKPAAPIQKIMSVPVIEGATLLGVMQLSRKGHDPQTAGPDFTPTELDAFARIASSSSRHIPW